MHMDFFVDHFYSPCLNGRREFVVRLSTRIGYFGIAVAIVPDRKIGFGLSFQGASVQHGEECMTEQLRSVASFLVRLSLDCQPANNDPETQL